MAISRYNSESGKWEVVASGDASHIALHHEHFEAKDVHSALSEIYDKLVGLKQNITWLYRNSGGKRNQSFPYALPMLLSAYAPDGNGLTETDEDGRKRLHFDSKEDGDEVSAAEFNALVNVINTNADLFMRMGAIEVPTDQPGVMQQIELRSAEDIISFIQDYGSGLPSSNLRPKLVFDKKTFVFPQRGQIKIPFTIVDGEGGHFTVSFTMKKADGSSSVYKFTDNDDYTDGNKKAKLSAGDNVIMIPNSIIDPNSPGSHRLSSFTVYDGFYKASEPVDVSVLVGTISITEFAPPSLVHVGNVENIPVRFTSVLRNVSLYYKINRVAIGEGDTLEKEEVVDITLPESFTPTLVNSYHIQIAADRNDEYTLSVYLFDTETGGNVVKTQTITKRFVSLDEQSICVLPRAEKTVCDRDEIIKLDLEIIHQAQISPDYDIRITSDGNVDMVLKGLKSKYIEGVSIQADTEMSTLTLTFEPIYNGTEATFVPLKKSITFTVSAPEYGSVDTGVNAVCWFDARGRNNSEEPEKRDRWPNKLKKNQLYGMDIYNIVDGVNGWEAMRNNLDYTGNCLKLSAAAYAELPNYQPFKNFNTMNGLTLEVCMHSAEAMSTDTTLFSLGEVLEQNGKVSRNGIFISPSTIDVYMGNSLLSQPNSNDTVTYLKNGAVNVNEEEFLHITVVFKRDGSLYQGKDLCLIYINGIISNAMVMPDATSMIHSGHLVLNGYRDATGHVKGNGTAKFRFVRVYNTALSKEKVLTNYVASMYNTAERSVVLEANRLWAEGQVPFVSKMYSEGDGTSMTGSLPVPLVWSFGKGREGELYGDNVAMAEFVPNPVAEDGVSKFENVTAYTKWQGSSSLDYLVKNYEIDMAPPAEGLAPVRYRMTPEFPLLAGYQMKANYIDSSGANNICMGKLANQVWGRNWSNETLKTIQKYRDPEMTDPIYLNPMFRVQTDAGQTVTYRYPMYSRFHALNGFPYILYKDYRDRNAMGVLLKNRFGGIYMCNLKQDLNLYGYDSEQNSSGSSPQPGPWSRHIYYRHDSNGQSTFASELTAYIGLFDPRAIRSYSRNGKTFTPIKYKEFGGVKRSLEECLGFELLMCYEQRNPDNLGLGLRNGKDHTQWTYNHLLNSNEFGKSLEPFTDYENWKYRWEWNSDARYMYVIGTGKEPMRRVNAQDEYTFNSLPVRNISKFLTVDGNNKFLEWDKYAALAFHQNVELINAILWVATSSDEEFSNPEIFNRYFRLDGCIDYVIMAMLFQMSDSLGRNLTLVSWDRQKAVVESGQLKGYVSEDKLIFYPHFYDMDTSFGTDVYGSISDPYLPWPHAIGRYEGVETRVQTLYWIEADRNVLDRDSSSLVLSGYERNEEETERQGVKDPVFRYAYFAGNDEIGKPTDRLVIPSDARSVKVLMYGVIGAEEKLLAYLHLPVRTTGYNWVCTTSERYVRSDYAAPYFSWIVNNDNVVMREQVGSVSMTVLKEGVEEAVESVAIKVDGKYVQLSGDFARIDTYYPFRVRFDAESGAVIFRCERKDGFSWYCQGDVIELRATTVTGYRVECTVDMRLNNSFEFSYNCVSSNLWRRLCKYYGKAVMARYSELRKGYVDANNVPQIPILTTENILDKYCSQIVNRIGEQYYNDDAFLKYFGSEYDSESEIKTKRAFVGNARGNKFLFIKDFLKKRLVYVDAMLGYVDETSATKGSVSIRHGHTGVMTLKLASVAPAFVTVQWVQGETTPVYLPGGNELVEVSYDYGDHVSSGQAWMKLLNCSAVSEIQGLRDRKIEKIELNGITALKRLDISMNSFVQENPLSFINCVNLEDLSLANVTGNGKAINLNIEPFEQLKRLDLSNSVVTVNSFSANRLLEYLNISRNNFLTSVNLDGCRSLQTLKLTPYNITQLNISNSAIDLSIEESDERLKQWSNLTSFVATNNTGLTEIVKTGNSFENLRTIEVSNCQNLRRVVGLFKGNTSTMFTAATLSKFLRDCPNVEDITDLFNGSSLVSLPDHFVGFNGTLVLADRAFKGCSYLTELPYRIAGEERVYFLTRCPHLSGTSEVIAGTGLSSLPDYFLSQSQISDVSGLFRGMTSLKSVGQFLFDGCFLSHVAGLFEGSGIEMLPANLFRGMDLRDFSGLCKDCISLSVVSEGCFDDKTPVDTTSMFDGCTMLSTLPVTFFASTANLVCADRMFRNCERLSTLPAGFLVSCPVLESVEGMLMGNLISVLPAGFLSKCPALRNVRDLLNGCALTEIPAGLFGESLDIDSLNGTFAGAELEEIPDDFLVGNRGIASIAGAFGDSQIKRIGNNFMRDSTGLTSIASMFEGNDQIVSVGNGFLYNSTVTVADKAFKNSTIETVGHGFLGKTRLVSAIECFMGCVSLSKIGTYTDTVTAESPVDDLLTEPYLEEEEPTFTNVSSLVNIRGVFSGSGLHRTPKGFLSELDADLPELKLETIFGGSDIQFINGDMFRSAIRLERLPGLFSNTEIVAIPRGFLSHTFVCVASSEVCLDSKIRIVAGDFLCNQQGLLTTYKMFENTPHLEKVCDGFLSNHPNINSMKQMFKNSAVRYIGEGILANSPEVTLMSQLLCNATQLQNPVPVSLCAGKEKVTDIQEAFLNAGSGVTGNVLSIPEGWLVNTDKLTNFTNFMKGSSFGGALPTGFMSRINNYAATSGAILGGTKVTKINSDFLSNYPHSYCDGLMSDMPELVEVENGFTDGWFNISTVANFFANCPKLKSVPVLFRNCTRMGTCNKLFANSGVESIPVGFLDSNVSLQNVAHLFNLSKVKELPSGFLAHHPLIEVITYFGADSGLERLNDDLFAESALIKNANEIFTRSSLEYAGDNFFANQPALTSVQSIFSESKLKKIPKNFCANSQKLENAKGIFFRCYELDDEIPASFLSNHPKISEIGTMYSMGMFQDCTKLHGKVPKNFLGQTTSVNSFTYVFMNSGITEFEDGFGDSITSFSASYEHFSNNNLKELTRVGKIFSNLKGKVNPKKFFEGCTKLVYVDPALFMQSGLELGDVSYTFGNCMSLTSALPAWWTKPGNPSGKNSCFQGCVRASNWATVPSAWGGPAKALSVSDYAALESEVAAMRLELDQLKAEKGE